MRHDRPLLAVMSSPSGISPMTLSSALSDRYELVWLVDSTTPPESTAMLMLRRLGEIVDISAATPTEAAARLAPYGPDGLLTFQDPGMVVLAEISAELGLAFHTPEVAHRLVDKLAQREALDRAGVKVPRYLELPDELGAGLRSRVESHVGFPAVLKPREGTGSRYVVAVGSFDELVLAVEELRAEGIADPMLLEEFIAAAPGDDEGQFARFVSVESYVSKRVVSNVAVTGRFKFVEPFRETGNFIPAEISDAEKAAVLELAADAAAALGVDSACLHTEIKFAPDGPRLIEVNGRPGGGIPQMISRVSDLDLLDVACQLALSATLEQVGLLELERVVYRALVQPPMSARRVKSISGLDRLTRLPGVDRVILNRGPGEVVDGRKGYLEFVYMVDGTAGDHDELRSLDRRLRDEVVIAFE